MKSVLRICQAASVSPLKLKTETNWCNCKTGSAVYSMSVARGGGGILFCITIYIISFRTILSFYRTLDVLNSFTGNFWDFMFYKKNMFIIFNIFLSSMEGGVWQMEDPLVPKTCTQILESWDRAKLLCIRDQNREDLGKGIKEPVRQGKHWVGRKFFDNKYGKTWENRHLQDLTWVSCCTQFDMSPWFYFKYNVTKEWDVVSKWAGNQKRVRPSRC